MLKHLIITITLFWLTAGMKAQQLPLYSQYSMNRFLINPAVAGTEGFTTISLTAREQWVGFKGTPKTHSITIDSKLLPDSYIAKAVSIRKKKRKSSRAGKVGIGAHIYNDHNGPIDRTGFEGTYAYHLDVDKTLISFGLSVNFFQLRLNTDKLNLSDNFPDDVIDGGKHTLFIPDASIGVYAVSQNYYAGISTINVLQSTVQFGKNKTGDYHINRQYNIMGGYKYELNKNFLLEPSLLLKIPQTMRAQMDIQVKLHIKREYWAGLTFRTGSAISVFGGAKVDRYYLGYAFDYNFNSLMNHTYGSHEIMAAIKFGETARRYKWLNTY
jgi:type IX secretion system PorP/SprF family membrane protein